MPKMSRPSGSTGVGPEAFSALLLDLYRYARELTLADFQRRVLERLSEVLPFDAAWWGMSGPSRELHSSYLFNMPARFVELWCSIREQDLLAAELEHRPGVTVFFGPRQIAQNASFARLLCDVGVRQTLGTLLMNPALNLSTFLSLYRSRDTPPYTEAERQLKQLVMPHLWAAWTSNWIAQLASARTHSFSSRVALAVADQMGTLHAAAGDLNRVKRIVKLLGLVNSAPTFTEHHLVINGASELLGEVFGAAGPHARSAFGVAQIPMGACVEIELIAELA